MRVSSWNPTAPGTGLDASGGSAPSRPYTLPSVGANPSRRTPLAPRPPAGPTTPPLTPPAGTAPGMVPFGGPPIVTTAANLNPAAGPPPPPAPTRPGIANPNVPGATLAPYGPDDDLRGAMITPGQTPRATTAAGQTTSAANAVSNFSMPTAVGSYADSFASRLTPDALPTANRAAIAQQRLEAFDTAAQPGIRDGMQAAGQNAAKFGRIGSGMAAVDTLRPYTDYLTQRSAMATNLAADTAEGEIGDAVRERDTRLQSQRDALSMGLNATGQESAANLSRFNAMSANEQDIYGREAGQRDELRGERGFQQGMNQTGIDNEFRRRTLENDEYGQDQDDYIRQLALSMGVDPSVAYESAAARSRR